GDKFNKRKLSPAHLQKEHDRESIQSYYVCVCEESLRSTRETQRMQKNRLCIGSQELS
ncbi:hypothetical protein WMY93_032473, partial [Mugilogobius chulae]